ncbi:MAG: L-threonylcarbamoyladenylate synthase [Microthrixaceae bacterium]
MVARLPITPAYLGVMEVAALSARELGTVAKRTAASLRAGAVVLIPTDTVYGLAVAVDVGGEALARVKRRDPDKPIAVLVAEPPDGLAMFEAASAAVSNLAQAGWPGPLTLVGRAGPDAPQAAVTPHGTIGVRCPADAFVHQLATLVGPLSVTSANLAGNQPMCSLAGLDEANLANRWPELSNVALAVDGGELPGAPSTVVDVTGDQPRIVRAGPVDEATLREWWG